MNARPTYEGELRKMMSAVARREPLLVIADDGSGGQALGLVTAPSGGLMLVAIDRDGDTAALTLTAGGVKRIRDALTGWLEVHS